MIPKALFRKLGAVQLEAHPGICQQEHFDWDDTPQPTYWVFLFPAVCVTGISPNNICFRGSGYYL